jgi:hypothetical protein
MTVGEAETMKRAVEEARAVLTDPSLGGKDKAAKLADLVQHIRGKVANAETAEQQVQLKALYFFLLYLLTFHLFLNSLYVAGRR